MSDNPVLFGILGPLLTALTISAQTPAEDGSWSEPFDLPLISIHAAILPTGKVLLFGSEHGGGMTECCG